MLTNSPEKIKFAAEINNVRELTLTGRSNLYFWKDHLAQKGLLPYMRDGNAEIVISATEMKWKGVRFNEFAVSLTVHREQEPNDQTAYYLIQAFNSVRWFALSERIFFSTPYNFGRIKVNELVPSVMELKINGDIIFEAVMNKPVLMTSAGYENWVGRVYLPGCSISEKDYFIARIAGERKNYAFSKSDYLAIKSSEKYPVFDWLVQSEFTAFEWGVRSNAFHGKSRTRRKAAK